MGQKEILEYLADKWQRGYKGFFTAKEIAEACDLNYKATTTQINQMLKYKELERNCVLGWKLAVRINPKIFKVVNKLNNINVKQ